MPIRKVCLYSSNKNLHKQILVFITKTSVASQAGQLVYAESEEACELKEV